MAVDLDAAKKLCAAASQGPWKVDADRVCDGRCGDPVRYHDGSCCDHRSSIGCYVERHRDCMNVARDVDRPEDVAFIAAARTFVPELIGEVEQLRTALGEALEWASAPGEIHDKLCAEPGGFASELRPTPMRIGARVREERLAELRALL